MSTHTTQHGGPFEHSPKRQKTSGSYAPTAGNGTEGVNDEALHHMNSNMLKPRAYQEEMLAQSLKQNVIIAMDTGSGKTQIAILRIKEELWRCPDHKLVWFTTPTVVLALQQYNVICQQLPAFQSRLITGSDNVDHWSSQEVWDLALLNVRIVVSTPAVLSDALENGFVRMNRLALLVFDEAHHCLKNAPGAQIMKSFYHAGLQSSGSTDKLPHILGLTASPTTNGSEATLNTLEQSLNAICKTPKLHREDLMNYVHCPKMEPILYTRDSSDPLGLGAVFDGIIEALDIEQDPLIKRLRKRDDPKSQKKLSDALSNGRTPCRKQTRQCFQRTMEICAEIGPWAAHTFISECRRCLWERCQKAKEQVRDAYGDWDYDDDLYISEALEKVPIPQERQVWRSIPDDLSPKARLLIQLLENEFPPGTRAIIFAKERASVVMLAHLIAMHPQLKHISAGSFLGSSSNSSRESTIIELTKPKEQEGAVTDLHVGRKNLLVCTSVLEEGVDVRACDLVICFDPPSNLRSFIQRRGRARKEASKFVIFLNGEDKQSTRKWDLLEKSMKDMYEDDMRQMRLAEERESIVETGYGGLRIPSTQAFLTLENARNHLNHFCATLSQSFTEWQPDFQIIGDSDYGLISAKVMLPKVLDPQFREFYGRCTWKTEKMAKRDAAFQAYRKLHKAGLVNDNLMPAHVSSQKHISQVDKRPSLAQVSGSVNPWAIVASQWKTAKSYYQNAIEIVSEAHSFPGMIMVLPVPLSCDFSFKLFWNEETTLTVSLKKKPSKFAPKLVDSASNATHIILSSNFAHRMVPGCLDFPCLFIPDIVEMATDSIHNWCETSKGAVTASDFKNYDTKALKKLGLVRRLEKYSQHVRPLVAENCLWMQRATEDEIPGEAQDDGDMDCVEELHLEGPAWPKRTDFLHPVMNIGESKAHTSRRCHPVNECRIDKLPVGYAMFSQFVPSILHNVGNHLIAQELKSTILAPVGFKDLGLILTSISTSLAREDTNYQRLEFFGDCQLKLHTSLQLAAENLMWHEDLLSSHKDAVVSNTRLSKAAIETGLHKFILHKAFTGVKWRPFYNSDHLKPPEKESTREVSTKTLADVVEALIGAATVDGGREKALKCLEVFLPEVGWTPYKSRVQKLHDAAGSDSGTVAVAEIEELVDYEFSKKSLLVTALTHPSHIGPGMTYQRLEFIGDAVLDSIVVGALFKSPKQFPHYQMHLMRSALVNADFLAFLAMNTSTEILRGTVSSDVSGDGRVTTGTVKHQVAIWEYMRHSASLDIVDTQQKVCRRFNNCRKQIINALETSQTFPWTLLCHIGAGKFFSDLVESLLGGIFIDSHGSTDACHAFLERIGLMRYLRRVLSGDIDIMHPKERLGTIAGKKKLKVEYKAEQLPPENKEGDLAELGLFSCRVQVGDEDMTHVEGATSRLEAETKAAEEAIATMGLSNCSLTENILDNGDETNGEHVPNQETKDESLLYSVD